MNPRNNEVNMSGKIWILVQQWYSCYEGVLATSLLLWRDHGHLKSLFGSMTPESEFVTMWYGVWQQAVIDQQPRAYIYLTLKYDAETARWEWHGPLKPRSPPLVTHLPPQGHISYFFPSSSTNWGLNIPPLSLCNLWVYGEQFSTKLPQEVTTFSIIEFDVHFIGGKLCLVL